MALGTVNKAIGGAAGGVIAIPSAIELWTIVEKYIGDMAPVIDMIGIALIGAGVAFVVSYFTPANTTTTDAT